MRRIKIPQQDFALKMQGGGAYARGGGVFAGHYMYGIHDSCITALPHSQATPRFYLTAVE